MTWTSGANAGRAVEVKRHDGTLVELWAAPARDIAAGDAFAVTAGCEKSLTMCRDRFANVANHRGFPHMPGNDFAMSYPDQKDGRNDGGRRG